MEPVQTHTLNANAGARPTPPQTPPFPEIFRDYGSFVWRTLRAHGVPDGHLDDACQEVFLTVFRRLDSFEGRSKLRTWIYGICIRVSMNCLRRAHMRREIPVEVLPEGGGAPPQEREFESKQLADQLMCVLSQLAPSRREVYRLYEIEGLTMPEVARIVACPLSTAYSRLHAARRHVEAAMGAGDNRGEARVAGEGRRRTELALSVVALEIPPREALERLSERLSQPLGTAPAAISGAVATSSLMAGWKTAAAVAAIGLATTGAMQSLPTIRHAQAAPAVLVSTPESESTVSETLARQAVPEMAHARSADEATTPTTIEKSHKPKRPSARRQRPVAKMQQAEVANAQTLAAELTLLRRAQRALDARPQQALALIREHERDFSGSAFEQEREALAIEALLQAGQQAAAQGRAERFQKRFPASAYRRRIVDLMAEAQQES